MKLLLKLCFIFIYLMSNIDLSGFYILNLRTGYFGEINIGGRRYTLDNQIGGRQKNTFKINSFPLQLKADLWSPLGEYYFEIPQDFFEKRGISLQQLNDQTYRAIGLYLIFINAKNTEEWQKKGFEIFKRSPGSTDKDVVLAVKIEKPTLQAINQHKIFVLTNCLKELEKIEEPKVAEFIGARIAELKSESERAEKKD